MNLKPEQNSNWFDKGFILIVITYYFTICALTYLWGYWETFGIDPLNYIGLSEIFNYSSVKLVFILSIFIPIYIIIPHLIKVIDNHVSTTFIKLALQEHQNSLDIQEEKIRLLRIKYKYFPYFLPVSVIALIAIQQTLEMSLSIIGAIIFLFLIYKIKKMPYFENIIPHETVRILITAIIIVFPVRIYFQGLIDAHKALSTDYSYSVEDFTILKPDKKSSLKYLGKLGAKLIFLTLDNKSIIITDQHKLDPLILHPHSNKE